MKKTNLKALVASSFCVFALLIGAVLFSSCSKSPEQLVKDAMEAVDEGNLDEAKNMLFQYKYDLHDFGGTDNMAKTFYPAYKKLFDAYKEKKDEKGMAEVVDMFKVGPCDNNPGTLMDYSQWYDKREIFYN